MLVTLWYAAGQPTVEQLLGSTDEPLAETPVVDAAATWDCFWQPTINDDWHDDVLCVRGLESQRPYLLADQPVVTEAEMTDAGEAYEATLNGAG
jgi:hypothetical protein